jgi:sugar phosphate permease
MELPPTTAGGSPRQPAVAGASRGSAEDSRGADSLYNRIAWRLVPFLFVCYLFNYLDRVNVGFAKLQMLDALDWSETVYGLGAGIFFVGYVLSGVPSNLLLHRLGARRVVGSLMVMWGAASAALLLVRTPAQFYTLRLVEGVFEAGFFPGIVLYLTRWFPMRRRGQIMGLFMSAIPVSGVIGGPLSGWMMEAFAGRGGLAGWQWMLLLQGVPTIVLGLLVYLMLCDGAEFADWLNATERTQLAAALAADERLRQQSGETAERFAQVLRNPRVWLLGLVYFCIQMGVYAINFWLPTLIKSLGIRSTLTVGWVSAVPYLCAGVFMVLVGRSADRRRERRWHLSGPLLLGLCGLLLASHGGQEHSATVLIGLTLATMGALSGLPMFWPLPTALLGSTAAAGGIALINSLGQIAGFVSPLLVGWIKDRTGSTDIALTLLSAVLCLGALLVPLIPARTVNR